MPYRHSRAVTTMGAPEKAPPTTLPRRWLVLELWLVFGLSLGASAVRALLDLVSDVNSGVPLSKQATALNVSHSPGHPWIDLSFQLFFLLVGVVPVLLALHFLTRSGESGRDIGLDTTQPATDGVRGAVLAAVVGGAGLGFYLLAHASGANLTVVAEDLPHVWWRFPVLVLSAAQNGLLEEVLVAGYLLHRLDQLGWTANRALGVSALIRGGYHLYQGLGGFAGNLVMGLIFGRLYQRWRRTTPLIVAHTLMDAVAFIGYALLVGHVSWLPTPG